MTVDDVIREKLDVKQIGCPPILCWCSSSRHRLQDHNIVRNKIANLFAELHYQLGAEIGVDRGIYSEILLQSNPGLKLLCVDAWASKRGEEHYQDALQRLSKYNVMIMRTTSLVAVEEIADEFLDFVYIDSQRNFNAIMMDLISWGRKVKKGGIIAGRGYCEFFETGVVKAVNAYAYSHNIRNWYITRDIEPNYLIVKSGI